MDKILHNVQVFRPLGKYDPEKDKRIVIIDEVYADVYKILVRGCYPRLICAYKDKSRWIPMDVLTGLAYQGIYRTKTTALQSIEEYLNSRISLNFKEAEEFLQKHLDEKQKKVYNKYVDLCEN
jgi:orotate phosphoribosyltransferase